MARDVVPAGHIAVPMINDCFAPHLRAGEFAVIDTTDKAIVFGEFYALTISSPRHPSGHVIKIVQPRWSCWVPDGSAVMYAFMLPRPGRMVMADGPLDVA